MNAPEFNERFWSQPEDQLVKALRDGGWQGADDELRAMARAAHVLTGQESDQSAERDASGSWTRQQAPGSGTEHDSSPDNLGEMRRENARYAEEDGGDEG